MRKKSSIVALLGFVFAIGLISVPVSMAQEQDQDTTAQVTATTQTETETQRLVRQEIQKRRADSKKVVQEQVDKFQSQIKNIKNEAKAAAMQKINAAIIKINSDRVDHYLDLIGKIELVLDRVQERVIQADREGQPTGRSQELILSARAAIVSARSAIMSQSGMIYNLEATGEENLRKEAQTVRGIMFSDLTKVHNSVKEARDIVVQIIVEFNNAAPKQ